VIDKLKQRWVAKDGSIFVVEAEPLKLEFQKKNIRVQQTIAFNIGHETAEHIVRLHNASLMQWDGYID
jgi:hypothetical protein